MIAINIPRRKCLKIFVESDAISIFFTKFAVPKFGLIIFKWLILSVLYRFFIILKVIRDVTT